MFVMQLRDKSIKPSEGAEVDLVDAGDLTSAMLSSLAGCRIAWSTSSLKLHPLRNVGEVERRQKLSDRKTSDERSACSWVATSRMSSSLSGRLNESIDDVLHSKMNHYSSSSPSSFLFIFSP